MVRGSFQILHNILCDLCLDDGMGPYLSAAFAEVKSMACDLCVNLRSSASVRQSREFTCEVRS